MAPQATPPASVVLLDALGTLVRLEPPGPHLRAELARRGVRVSLPAAEAAMRAEIAYYRAQHHRAGTPAALAVLRRACAGVVRDALGLTTSIEVVEAALLAAIRFRPYPEVPGVLAQLRADGAWLMVLSNWDVSLHEALMRTGLADRVDAALSSAEAGVAKPDPALFARALARVGARPQDALMVGDSVGTDVAGALAAGVAPVLVLRGAVASAPRAPGGVPAGVPVLPDLTGLPDLVRYRR